VQRVLTLIHVLAGLLMLMAVMHGLPLAWSVATRDGATVSLVQSALGSAGLGGVLWVLTRRSRCAVNARDGCLLVVVAWIVAAAVASPPFMLVLPGLSFTDALFEAMSALTTTGGTVLEGLDQLPPSLNLWRHVLQWLGGLGIIVLAIAVLPMLGVGGMQLFKADIPGPMKASKLTPRIMQTAHYLWLIYVALTVACILALRMAGMSWFDALCHAFSTVSLGGFSTRDAGVAAFDSLAIESVLVVFMLVAALNFTTHFLAWRDRRWTAYRNDAEARWVWGSVVVAVFGLAAYLYAEGVYQASGTAIRGTLYRTVAMATAHGDVGMHHASWPPLALVVLFVLGAVCSSSGSTGGGIKMVRALVLFKQAGRELLRMSHPRAVRPLLLHGHAVPHSVVSAVLGFILLYAASLLGVALLLLGSGLDLATAFSAAYACLNNIGPALGAFAPIHTFGPLSDAQTWVCTVAMLAGRLELLTFYTVLTLSFWRR
jgi:trk system potassium uptake protein TrkH